MVVSFYKGSSVQSAFFISVIAIVLWIFVFLHPSPVEGRHLMPLYEFLVFTIGQYPFLSYFISILMILLGAYLLNYIAREHELLNTKDRKSVV